MIYCDEILLFRNPDHFDRKSVSTGIYHCLWSIVGVLIEEKSISIFSSICTMTAGEKGFWITI
jgi:hypothetical protein